MSFNILGDQKISYTLENVTTSLNSLKNDDGFWLEACVKDSHLIGKSYISSEKAGEDDDSKVDFLMKVTLYIKQWLILNRHSNLEGFEEFVRRIGAYGMGDFMETPQQYASSIVQ